MADPTPPPPPGQQPGAQQPGFKPLRPGDPIPQGGIDPTQVFAAPPPPPPGYGEGGTQPQAQGQGQAAQAVGGPPPPPQDTGPPPPPVGVQPTKEMGYDDEDIRILGQVGNYRFGSLTSTLSNDKVVVPAHPETQFDEQKFLTLLRGSISLTRDEKWRIVQAVPKLSQFQIDELQKILEEERRKFSELSPKHLLQLMKLEQRHAEDWKDLQTVTVQDSARAQEQQQAEEIRKQLGL